MNKELDKPQMTVRERVETWLNLNKKLLNKTAWDREISTPDGTLQKHAKYGKKLNDDCIKKLNKRIKELTKINGKPYESV
jgi:hypothetical protein